MIYYCDCWKEDPNNGHFDAYALATVDVKINAKKELKEYERLKRKFG